MIWVVATLSRRANLENVLANFARQTERDRKLVVVENGAAIGACAERGFRPDVLLTSQPHQSHAKNEAIDEIRRRGGGLWTTFDDDDWYGRHHLAELVENRHRADVVGRCFHFIRMADGLYLFQPERANRLASAVAGPTITAMAEDTIEFPVVSPGEDVLWCRWMREAGATFWSCSVRHFVYSRLWTDHAWKAKDVSVRRQYGPARFFGDVPNEIAEADVLPAGTDVPVPTAREIFASMAST